MSEEWRDIQGYEGLYQVSNLGRVRSCDRHTWAGWRGEKALVKGRVRKPSITRQGYYQVDLLVDGHRKSLKVHRLVAIAFIPNPNNYPYINHKDENPLNNKVDNLEWCTQKYNVNYGTSRQRLSKSLRNNSNAPRKATVQLSLNGEVLARYSSISEAARQTGISQAMISYCCLGRYKTAKGFIFRYE